MKRRWVFPFATVMILALAFPKFLISGEYYVDDVAANGDGSESNPFNKISAALALAQGGDVVWVKPGSYSESIQTVKNAIAGQRIIIQAREANNRPVFRSSGTVLEIGHSHVTVDGLVIDGQFGNGDVVKITGGGNNAIIRNCEIKNGVKDGVDLGAADDVLIENCQIHHLLGGSLNNQVDAHGIVAAGQKNLTIRGCEIYYVSGDCFQTDPNRGNPLWDNVLIENSRLWTGPLPQEAAGWRAGEIPGENAVDTKINPEAAGSDYRARITIRNVEAFGFTPGFISNRAAFNIKEKVECRLIAVKVHDNEIAFRLRGPGDSGGAHVTVINAIVYNNEKTFRSEDGLEQLRIYNCTFDKRPEAVYFQNVSGGFDANGFDLKNSLFFGDLPGEALQASNLAADDTFFLNRSGNDYRLSSNSPAIDAGADIAEVTDDFDGAPRPAGRYDVGAYEYNSASGVGETPATGVNRFYLHPNFPNPFNPETHITFDMTRSGFVQLHIFDSLGRKVITLLNGLLSAGQHIIKWNGVDQRGNEVASGLYLCRLEVGQFTQTRKMQLLR